MSVASPDDLIGDVVDGRYTVLERIATGGMASVYRAADTRLDRDIALKVMRPHLAHDDAFVARFRREAKSAARLSHPNVVGVYDQGESDGLVFLAMEYVPGRTLRAVLDADAPLTPRAALDLMEPVLLALSAAHDAGFIHRDVKPENVIIREDGVVKVADFGLARAVTSETATSATNEVLGTLSYISPEQIELSDVTTRSDVYAAGLILFELLTGQKAFAGDSIPNVIFQHLHQGVPTPSSIVPGLPAALDSLVGHASAKDPADRPRDAGEFLAEVRHVRARLGDKALDLRPDPGAAAVAGETAPLPTFAGGSDAKTAAYVVPSVAGGSADTGTLPTGARPGGSGPGGPRPVMAGPVRVAPHRESAAAAAARPKGGRRGVIAALVALVVAAAATGWYFLGGPGAPTVVPKLVNLTRTQAEDALATAHLDGDFEEAFDEDVAKDRVVSATPGAGAELTRGDNVTVVISKGLERYSVPSLSGKTREDATKELADVNLAVGAVTEDYSEDVETGRIMSTNPGQGAELKRGAPVALVISKGPQPIDVPDLTDMTVDDATAMLTDLGLELVESGEPVFSSDARKGRIAEQDPATGTLAKGESITVTLSKGPEMIRVPAVFGRNQADAVRILENAGFDVKVERFLGAPLDTVTRQSPVAGRMAPKGSVVTITVV